MARLALALIILSFLAVPAMGRDIDLPAPFADKPPIYTLLKGRSSALLNQKMSIQDISLADASSILWAASGLNRPERGWVVPVAYGNAPAPYWRVYALHEGGVYLYNWKHNRLEQISGNDVRQRIFTQKTPTMASLILVFVQDGRVLDEIKTITSNRYAELDLGAIAVGAISQNVYLSAEALNMYTRFMIGINTNLAAPLLELDASDKFLGYMPLWYK